jgi:hypothetical protein
LIFGIASSPPTCGGGGKVLRRRGFLAAISSSVFLVVGETNEATPRRPRHAQTARVRTLRKYNYKYVSILKFVYAALPYQIRVSSESDLSFCFKSRCG